METFDWSAIAQGIPVLLLLLAIMWWGMRDPPGWVFGSFYRREQARADRNEELLFRLLQVAEKLEEKETSPSPPVRTRKGTP